MRPPHVPDGFIPFSEAVIQLANGMWGGLQRPVPVQTLRPDRVWPLVGGGRKVPR